MNTKISRAGGFTCRFGQCFCDAEVSTGHPHPHPAAARIVSLILSLAILFTLTSGIDISVYANTKYQNVYLGNNVKASDDVLYKFTPKETGNYKFTSDDFVNIQELEESDSFYYTSGNSSNVEFTHVNVGHLVSGKTYILECRGSSLNIRKLLNVKSIEVINPDVTGFFDYQLYPFSKLNIKIVSDNQKEYMLNLADLECHYSIKSVYFINNDFVFECNGVLKYGEDNSVSIKCNFKETSIAVNVNKSIVKAKLLKNPENESFRNGEIKLFFSDGSTLEFKNDAEKVNFGAWGGVGDDCWNSDGLLRDKNGTEIYVSSMFHRYNTNQIGGFFPSNNIYNAIYFGRNNVKMEYTILIHFDDLSDFEFYNNYVVYTSVNNSFLKGTNPPANNVFEPARAIDRAMMVTILYRMAGEPYANGGNPYTSSPFTDITNTSVYYYDAACWALKNGVTTETTFKPFNNVTREQTAIFLYRYAQDNDTLGDTEYKNVNLNAYHDGNSISHFAVDAMRWANYNGMITGTQQGYANPQGATQRIHATKILYGFGNVCNIGNFG